MINNTRFFRTCIIINILFLNFALFAEKQIDTRTVLSETYDLTLFKRPNDYVLPPAVIAKTKRILSLNHAVWIKRLNNYNKRQKKSISSNLFLVGINCCNGLHGEALNINEGVKYLLKATEIKNTIGAKNAALYIWRNYELFIEVSTVKLPVKQFFDQILEEDKEKIKKLAPLQGMSYLWQKYDIKKNQTNMILTIYTRGNNSDTYKFDSEYFQYFGIDAFSYMVARENKLKTDFSNKFYMFFYFSESTPIDCLKVLYYFLEKQNSRDNENKFLPIDLQTFEDFPKAMMYMSKNRLGLFFRNKKPPVIFKIPASPPFLKGVGEALSSEKLKLKIIKRSKWLSEGAL